jgi:hypothetical protein
MRFGALKVGLPFGAKCTLEKNGGVYTVLTTASILPALLLLYQVTA